MNTHPVIGINCDLWNDRLGEIVGIRTPYWNAVVRAGGTPFVFPPVESPDHLNRLLDRVDGMLLTGGDDLSERRLGIPSPPAVKPIDIRRENTDFTLIGLLIERRIPTLAVCLGCQELNVHLGGTLYQDLPTDGPPNRIRHFGDDYATVVTHEVEVVPDSLLAALWPGVARHTVNSLHHQAIATPGAGMRVAARSDDGIIEAFDLPSHPFMLAVQWHPEKMADDPLQSALFSALTQRSGRETAT